MIFQNLVSWSLLVGFALGFIASRIVALLRACWGKHTNARTKWDAVKVDPRMLAGFVCLLFVSWSVYQTQSNTNGQAQAAAEAKAFATRVQDCQEQLIHAIVESRKVTAANEKIGADNDRLSKEERTLLADLAKAQAEWLGELIAPPDPRIAALDPQAPARQEYGFAVSRTFFGKSGEINRRIQAIHDEQDRNEASRPKQRPALPDPRCGT